VIERERQRTDGIFSLIGLEIWGRQFLMGQDRSEVAAQIARASAPGLR
jgi:hypothetical protein